MRTVKELARLAAAHGPSGTVKKLFENIRYAVRRLSRMDINTRIRVFIDRRFDQEYGVDTSGLIGFKTLHVVGESAAAGVHYEPTPVPAARAILKRLQIDHRRYSFIDYGSGKGRMLLLASEYPYREVIGVEISDALNAVAEDNISRWGRRSKSLAPIRARNVDATQFELPDTPLVIFFFTPFFSPVIDKVVDRIQARLARKTGEVVIVYYGTNQRFLAQLERLQLPHDVIYRRRPYTALKRYQAWLFRAAA